MDQQKSNSGADVRRVIYTDPNGTDHQLTPEAAMKRHADDGWKGVIRELAAGEINEARKARAEKHEAMVTSLPGFAPLPGTWFPPGTEMMPPGKSKYKSLAKLHADLPPARDGLTQLHDQIKSENRTAIMVDAKDLRLDEAGRLTRTTQPGKPGIPVEREALRALVQRFNRAFPGAWAYLQELQPGHRAETVNAQLSRLAEYYPKSKDRAASVGVRQLSGAWQAYRVNSTSYLPMDGDMVARVLLAELEAQGLPDPRAEVSYDAGGTTFQVRVSWHADEHYDAGVGDVFEGGYTVRSNDAGRGRLTGGTFLRRVICINCTVMSSGEDSISRVHRGSRTGNQIAALNSALAKVRADLSAMIRESETGIRYFLDQWGILRESSAQLVPGAETASHAVRRLVESGTVEVKGVSKAQLLAAVQEGFAAEPGETLADVQNAFTRAAHASSFLNEVARWELERQAGELVPVLAGYAAEA